MDKYALINYGIKLGSKVLGISEPSVVFVGNDVFGSSKINAMFLPEESSIVFNEYWVEEATEIEILITCFHELRHAFQHKAISNQHIGDEQIDSNKISLWKKEFDSYKQSKGELATEDEEYLLQDIEVDAIAFAHFMITSLFDLRTYVPDILKSLVSDRVELFKLSYTILEQ